MVVQHSVSLEQNTNSDHQQLNNPHALRIASEHNYDKPLFQAQKPPKQAERTLPLWMKNTCTQKELPPE